jgi:hypothetical protein
MPPTGSAVRFDWGQRWVIKTMDRQIFAFVLIVIGDNHAAKTNSNTSVHSLPQEC